MDILKNYPLPLPKYDEQKKIVNLLSTWDKAIKQIQNQINLKTKLKKGLLQKLLTGLLRLSGSQPSKAFIKTKIGLLPDDWEVKAFTEVFKRISKPVQVESGKKYREIGIRSHGKGVFHKNPVTGAQLGNKRVFHVQPGTLVFNIVFAWEQAVGIFSEKENGFIASHRFPMFRADQAKCLEAFALLFFLSKRGKHGLGIASPGGAGRNKTLGQQELNHLYLPIPPIHEQKKIIHILNLCETEITQLTKQKNALETQKKGLMQKLLTGEIRV
jgi:type I restriction enzyme S subunit